MKTSVLKNLLAVLDSVSLKAVPQSSLGPISSLDDSFSSVASL